VQKIFSSLLFFLEYLIQIYYYLYFERFKTVNRVFGHPGSQSRFFGRLSFQSLPIKIGMLFPDYHPDLSGIPGAALE